MRKKKHWRVYLLRVLAGLIFAGGVFYLVRTISRFIAAQPVHHEKKIQPITILKPPPPPPPPPKVEEPPPEPEMEEKIEEPTPEPEPLPDVPDQPPAGDTGLDAEGTAGSDAFGLVGRKGGRGLLGGGGGSPYAWYAGTVKERVLDILSEHEELRRKSYSAIVKIWLDVDGTVSRIELARGSNDAEIDRLLQKLLGQFKKAKEGPPPGMEQPIKLKISSRL